MKKRTKTLILCLSIFVVAAASGFGLWYLLRDKAPVGNGNVLDVAWYHENGTEFTITTADELFEFAELSEYYDFKEQTIKLGADIVVNEGNAADWENTLPERSWKSIRKFAGTFDGQGHSISGLYGLGHLYALKGADKIFYTTGMFAETNAKCTIKNFKLLNSYFCSDLNEGVGSISSSGGGTFENIYSDAIVVSYKSNNGGIIGLFNQKGTISNCWFDGELRVEGNVGRFTGGIVGRVCATNGQSKIEHCLNTADISSTVVNRGMNTGGLIGNIQSQARINITDSLSVGDLTVDYTAGVGAFVGNIESSSAVIIKNAYVKAEAFEEVIYNANGSMTGAAVAHNEAMLTGYNAYKWSELDFKDYWAVVEDGTPILKSFADEVPSLKGVKKGYDISWYRPGEGEYLIKTPEQLYGLAILSYSNNFLGQAIYLGDNIVLNEGNAEDWATNAPENKWFSIGTYGFPFEGTFDGAGYTISGVYLNSCGGFGLFGDTSSSTAISNFKLENSYFEASGQTIGSIVGLGAGTIQNVYSNAIVVGNKGNVGGFAGQAKRYAGLQMNNCWFDGKAINLGNKSDTKKIGGLIGAVRSESAMNNCLNTGTIDASVFNYNQAKKKVNGEDVVDTENPIVVPIVGGLVGYVEKDVPFGIQDSLNVGKVLHHEDATAAYASVIGYIDGNVTAQNVYATTESCDNHPLKQSVSGQVCPMDTADLTGYKAYQWTLLDFEKNWAVNKKGTPILKAFAEEVPSLNGVKKEVDVSWYAADKKTFVLDSRQDLLGFRLMSYNTDFAEKTVKLGKDITLNTGDAAKWAESAPQYKWTPIGSQKYSFKGTFDGGMHSISGIYVKADTEYSGFFALLTEGTTVKNLKILNSYYESSADYLGSIAGSGNANLSNLYSNAILVSSANSAAGFVGRSTRDISITNCWFDGSATITGEGMPNRRAAGIVACAYSGNLTLSHCLNTGSVSAPNYVGTNSATSTAVVPLVGGLIGQVCRDAIVTIDDSLNAGDVTCNKAATTGYAAVVGYSDGDVTLTDTYATKESSEYQLLGKSKGYIAAYEKADISGYLGYQWLTLDFDKHWAVVLNPTVSTPILKVFANEVPSLAGIEKVIDTSWYDANKTEYVLSDMADLNGFAYLSNSNDFAGKTVKLGADIVVNQDMKNPIYKWDPIGTKNTGFAGTFDGQMHTISGLYTKTDVECAGLFASTTKDATVKNLILKDSYFESTAMNLGSIAGIGRGTFDTIKSEAIVVGHNARVGGFIGMNPTKGTKLTNCWFAGSVTNKGNGEGLRGTGGLVGVSYTDSDLTIENCLNTGDVDVSAYAYNQSKEAGKTNVTVLAGGLVGWFRKGGLMTMKDSLNVGRVIIGEAINNAYGSIVGYVDGDTKISNTYATEESSDRTRNGSKSGITVFPKAEISGVVSYLGNKLKLDFTKIWTLVDKETPVLRVFAKKTIDVTSVVDTTWYGDGKASTYTLYDRADLYGFAVLSQEHDFKGKTIKLGKDIQINAGNANDWSTSAPEMPWSPIASNDLPFQGTFDGQMYGISGVYYQTSSKFGGLFAAIGENATISNLKLTNSYFESTADTNSNFAALVGYGMGTIDTVYTDAIVVASGQNIAGFIGQMGNGAVLTECWFNGSITNARSKDMRTGGLAGFVTSKTTKSVIQNCLNTGTIQASTVTGSDVGVGGFVGWVQSGGVQLEIKNSLSAGTVSANTATKEFGSLIGGVGSNSPVKVNKVYATNESCEKVYGTTTVPTGTCIVYKTSEIAGEVGYQWERLDFDFEKVWTLITDDVPVIQAFAEYTNKKEIDASKVEKQVDTTWYDGVAGSTYTLYDKADLYGFAVLSQTYDFAGMTIELGANIVVNEGTAADWETEVPELTWTPIGKSTMFKGTFDGLMYTISGLYVKETTANAGLFGKVNGATIKNFKLMNSYIAGSSTDVGSVAGAATKCAMENIYSNAIVVSSNKRVGGLVGQMTGVSSIQKCWFDGSAKTTMTGSDPAIGGIVGLVQSDGTQCQISNCLNSGTISAVNSTDSGPEIGGLVGGKYTNKSTSTLTVENCLNTGSVIGASAVTGDFGPFIGYNANGTFENVYATTESCTNAKTMPTGTTTVALADIMGLKGYQWSKLDLDFANTWTFVVDDESTTDVNEESTPILQVFAEDIIDVSTVDRLFSTNWYDENATEYVLKDKADLYGFASLSQTNDFTGKIIKLGADIVINEGNAADWATEAPGLTWTPIGKTTVFKGTFDGQMYTISGLYVQETSANAGLFGKAEGATIQNLQLVNSYIKTSGTDAGSIVGAAPKCTIDNVYSDAIVVSSNKRVGGLVGQMTGVSSIQNCWFDGTVKTTMTGGDPAIGGIVGLVQSDGTQCQISNCLNSGTVSAVNSTDSGPEIGGLVGGKYTNKSTSTLTVKNCLNTGSVIGASSVTGDFGPFIGYNANGTFENVYATTESCTNAKTKPAGTQIVALENIIGANASTTLDKLFEDGTWVTVNGRTPVLKSLKSAAIDESWYTEGDNTFTLYDKADLYGFTVLSQTKDFAGKTIKLGADIVLHIGKAADWETVASGLAWTPIGKTTVFKGTFDGQMHTISGLYVQETSANAGLFGKAESATIQNLKLVNSCIKTSSADAGSIVGAAPKCAIENVYSDAIVVSSNKRVGGLVGQMTGVSSIQNCWFDGTVKTTMTGNDPAIGGIVGLVQSDGTQCQISNCLNSGTVSAVNSTDSGPEIGGLVGGKYTNKSTSTLTVKNCLNTGSVIGASGVTGDFGPFIGYNANGTFENVYATTESCTNAKTKPTGTQVVAVADITGANAATTLKKLFENGEWETVDAGTPILKIFSTKTQSTNMVANVMKLAKALITFVQEQLF